MRVLVTIFLFAFSATIIAEEYRERPNRMEQAQFQKMKAVTMADGSAAITNEGDDAAAIAPNPSAHAPSAQCRYGTSVTGAGIGFGAGISVSDWDEICGLWMAAQQTTGDARREAAAAAFCLTMKKAKVHSPTCAEWEGGQGVVKVQMDKANPGSVRFGGVGSGGWN